MLKAKITSLNLKLTINNVFVTVFQMFSACKHKHITSFLGFQHLEGCEDKTHFQKTRVTRA